MTFTSLVLQKLLATNAHLGRRVASRHSEVYVYGFRNEVAILDSDKTLICLRNALHFLGSLFRENGRVLIVNSNSLFDEITEQTAAKLGKNCLNDAQIMNLLSSSTKRKIRLSNTRKPGGRSIIGGVPALRPDCVVAMNAERESSAIIEAARNKIPVVSLIESDISLGLYKRVTYPVPANDSVQFVYLFCNLIAKTWYEIFVLLSFSIQAGKHFISPIYRSIFKVYVVSSVTLNGGVMQRESSPKLYLSPTYGFRINLNPTFSVSYIRKN